MAKIYTRHKIRIPKIYWNKKNMHMRMKKKNIIALIIFSIITVIIVTVIKAVLPVFDTLCEDKAKSIATLISNEQATIVMKNYSYNNIFEIEKDNSGNVAMIKSNIFTINEITSDIAIRIQEEINKQGRGNIEIALGTFSGLKLLAGRGPGVKIRISTIGNVETDLRSEFIARGINQTLHRVYLQVKCEISILTPFNDIKKNITNQVLLAENVIVGNIPSTFYNFEGENQQSTALEIIN